MYWKLGLITSLLKGTDGHARTVTVRTADHGSVVRPVTKLYPLEIETDSLDVSSWNALMGESNVRVKRDAAIKAMHNIRKINEDK